MQNDNNTSRLVRWNIHWTDIIMDKLIIGKGNAKKKQQIKSESIKQYNSEVRSSLRPPYANFFFTNLPTN